MKAKRSFQPDGFDRLESREAPSVYGMALHHSATQAHPQTTQYSANSNQHYYYGGGASSGLRYGGGPGYGGSYTM